MREYVTVQGDLWDSIARQLYDNEALMHILIDANPQYRNIAVFPANCILIVPEITRAVRVTWPPWRVG